MKLLVHGVGVYLEGRHFGADGWPNHDLLAVREGDILFQTPKGELRLSAGDAVWIPPRLKFRGLVESERGMIWVTHFLDRRAKPAVCTHLLAAGLGVFRGGARSALAAELMERIHAIYLGESRWPALAESYLHALLAEMGRNCRLHADASDQWLRPTEQWAREHLADRIGVKELAAHANLSESHFRKRFLQIRGLSAGRYLQDLRLGEVKALLQHSTLSLKEISDRAGYSDSVACHRAFVTKFRITPIAYRKTIISAV